MQSQHAQEQSLAAGRCKGGTPYGKGTKATYCHANTVARGAGCTPSFRNRDGISSGLSRALQADTPSDGIEQATVLRNRTKVGLRRCSVSTQRDQHPVAFLASARSSQPPIDHPELGVTHRLARKPVRHAVAAQAASQAACPCRRDSAGYRIGWPSALPPAPYSRSGVARSSRPGCSRACCRRPRAGPWRHRHPQALARSSRVSWRQARPREARRTPREATSRRSP